MVSKLAKLNKVELREAWQHEAAPTKCLSQEHLDEFGIDFAQLPFEIYRLAK